MFTLGCFEVISDKFISVLVNQSGLLCVGSIILFLTFGCSLLNPNALSDLNSKALKEVNNEYADKDLQFRPFIEVYNRLESLIFAYALELEKYDSKQEDIYDSKDNRIRMQIFQALNILSMHEIINKEIYTKIDELRRYRNALVHSTDEIRVNSVIFNELQEIYNKIKEVYDSREDVQLQKDKIKELYEYGREILLNERDKEILRLIDNNPEITLKEISLELACTKSTINRKIFELCKKGKLRKENGKYKVLVDRSEFVH